MLKLPSLDSGPPLVWRLMRLLQEHYGHFTSPALTALVGNGHRKTIEHYLAFLRSEGIIEVCAPPKHPRGDAYQYRIVRDGEAPPSARSPGATMGFRQQAMWTAMRSLRTFTPAELALAASTELISITSDTARPFIFDLKNAGVIVPIGGNTYRLLPSRNSGPRAPIVLRKEGAVFDVNLMRRVNVTASTLVAHGGRAA
jgi:hypothetical protein